MNRLKYVCNYAEYLGKRVRAWIVNDETFHISRLQRVINRKPDLMHPRALSEKICHRLLFDRNPLYTRLADKLAVREYIQNKTDKLTLAPLLGIYTRVEEIDFSQLPEKFVLKCNHDSGSVVICTDKATFDKPRALAKLKLAMKKNMYYSTREWQYKNITPVILCETYIDLFTDRIKDTTPEMLRIHCFHGIASLIEADITDSSGKEYINVYDRAWQLQPFQMEYPNTPYAVSTPPLLYEALDAAQDVARDIDYCRVDLMLRHDAVVFSEITLSPRRGKLQITPAEWDIKLGDMWQLAGTDNRL
ncbi:ATP-grasp fold amidoligase family protein [Kosakonia sp. WA-90]|uniref:ATP-grasp fold amidoligase family protein n=1 Tax=Kosakonia sp. WA-90 TaxID=3153576 RepID=UPI00325D8FBA